MPIKLDAESHGKLFIIHVSGKLTKEDYAEFVPAFERLMVQHGKLRLLLDMTGFIGCEVSAAWEEFKLGVEHYVDIERIAMVGEKQWQHNMATFCKPFTRATVRYFDHADAATARQWLDEAERLQVEAPPRYS